MKFYGRPVCDPCWDKYNAEDQPSFILKKILGVTPDEEPKDLPPHMITGHEEFDAERRRKHEEARLAALPRDEKQDKRDRLKNMLQRWKKVRTG